jgi:hypothetical protein
MAKRLSNSTYISASDLARLAGVSRQRVDYWLNTDRYKFSIDTNGRRRIDRLSVLRQHPSFIIDAFKQAIADAKAVGIEDALIAIFEEMGRNRLGADDEREQFSTVTSPKVNNLASTLETAHVRNLITEPENVW